MEAPIPSQWCLVGNIKEIREFGPDGIDQKSGTKHFSAGTKVFCLPAQWGDGYEKIVVVGKHRGARQYARMVIRSDWVTNWRAKVVYDPQVLARINEFCAETGHANWKSKEHVLLYLESIHQRENRHAA